ncbi:hypothetical protein PInf_026844 [Phytophthora infestans]|nr:hypothetical protein PInf_026844 [Phytophthora infestans]
MEVPLCADAGAGSNVLTRGMVKELCALDSSVVMKPPTVVKVAGGTTLECRNSVKIDVRIGNAAVDKLVDEAVEAELESPLADDLRVLVHEYEDVWRLRIGADAPATAEPMQITLLPDAQPYGSGVRKYPDMQRAFMRTVPAT